MDSWGYGVPWQAEFGYSLETRCSPAALRYRQGLSTQCAAAVVLTDMDRCRGVVSVATGPNLTCQRIV